MKQPLATLKALGCDQILLTNAAGSLREDIMPGELMLIDDHINWSGRSPLIGVESDDRFVGLTEAYDASIRAALAKAAEAADVALKSGVYAWFSGPNFETPAEIRAARILGADAVGMSTVPEVILARWMGLRVAAISTITNFGAGMTGNELSHEETKEMGPVRRSEADQGDPAPICRQWRTDRRAGCSPNGAPYPVLLRLLFRLIF